MITFTLVPEFLHQRFPATRSALLGEQNVEVAIDKETALHQEVLLFDSQTITPSSEGSPVSLESGELVEVEAESQAVMASQPKTVLAQPKPVLAKPKTVETLPAAQSAQFNTSKSSFFSTKFGQLVLSLTMGLALVVMLVVLAPSMYYRVFPADSKPVEALEEGTPLGGSFEEGVVTPTVEEFPLPPQDETLPEGMWLVIPKIGVRTQLDPSLSVEEALLKGVWIAPEYGMPGDRTQPVILAAHRFGWQWWWKDDYWKYHSFYMLPDLEPGDMVEVISDQRKYHYEIYAGEEGDLITDYTADMILYTCKFLNSPVRHLRYARLVDMTKDTQG